MTKASTRFQGFVVLKAFQTVTSCLHNDASTSVLTVMLKPVATMSANGNCLNHVNLFNALKPPRKVVNSMRPKSIGIMLDGSLGSGIMAMFKILLIANAEEIPTAVPT